MLPDPILDAYVRELVDAAPPLSEAQRSAISALLRPVAADAQRWRRLNAKVTLDPVARLDPPPLSAVGSRERRRRALLPRPNGHYPGGPDYPGTAA